MAPRRTRGNRTTRKVVDEKVTLGDSGGMKHALDKAILRSFVENGFEVDYTYSNMKLVLGFLAIALALVAQFWPGTLEANWFLILSCVVIYVVISIFLGLFLCFIEKDAFMFTIKGKKNEPPLRISSTLPKFSDKYTLMIEAKDPATYPDWKVVSCTNSVGRYFYSDGALADAIVTTDAVKLMHTFEKKD